MSLEEDLRATRDAVKAQTVAIETLTAAFARLRAELKPKVLRRPALAAMFGMSSDSLRTALSRGKHGKSQFGAKLLELAQEIGGEQVWLPSDIQRHCRPWLGCGDDEAGDGACG